MFCFSERERQKQKMETEKEYAQKFLEQREVWKEKEKERLVEENAQIARFAAKQQEREAARKEAKQAAEEQKAKVQKEVPAEYQ